MKIQVMQNNLSKLLLDEHNIIQKAGKIIFSLKNTWLDNTESYEKNIQKLIEFFSAYSDDYHHKKEEEILFIAISQKNESIGGGMVDELLDHHETFRASLQKISKLLAAKDYQSVQYNLESYVVNLEDHIAIENDEVFPMTDSIFEDEELEMLYHKCIDKDNELGIERKKEFEEFINEFNA